MTLNFDNTVPKIRKDGVVVMSSSLSKGEKLLSGETYAEVAKRLGTETAGIPAPEQEQAPASNALTLDPTMTSSILASDVEIAEEHIAKANAEAEANQAAAAANDAAAVSVPNEEISGDDEADDKDKTGERPADSADKSTWYEYALGKGHKGEYDDITKQQLIEQYGA